MTLPAYIDSSCGGLVPCVVIAADKDRLTVRVTARNNRVYRRGDVVEHGHRTIVPRSAVFKVRGSYFPRIGAYSWARIIFGAHKL